MIYDPINYLYIHKNIVIENTLNNKTYCLEYIRFTIST